MDVVTAGLIGASLGVAGTLGGAAINPFTAARHAREAKNIELRREAYAAGLKLVYEITTFDSMDDARPLARAMTGPLVQMQLVASQDVAELYADLADIVSKIVKEGASESHLDFFGEAYKLFRDAARADIGIDY